MVVEAIRSVAIISSFFISYKNLGAKVIKKCGIAAAFCIV
jgi:hypothetical protein